MNQDKAAALAEAVKVFLQNAVIVETHTGKTKHREWANYAQVWLYPGDAWGVFEPAKLEAMHAALKEYEDEK